MPQIMTSSVLSKNMESNVAQLPLSDRLWDWFETYKRQIALVTVIALVAGLAIWFIIWQKEAKQVDAGTALSQVAAAQIEAGGSRAESAEAYLKVAKDYPGTISGARALLLGAGSLFTEGKYTDAQAQFERFVREYQGSPFMGEALFGIASCLDAQGKTDQAANAYKDLVTRHPNENFVPQAKFALARIYEGQNKPEQARDLYQEVERSAPFTSIGNEAGVRLEELIAKYPKLEPAPPPPSASTITNLAPLLEKK
jgi:outer membrane protein assembly factor BamD (BamD/ComL family)